MDAIEAVEQELNEATRRAWSLVQSTDGRLFTVRPHSGEWSAAECLAHLSISTDQFLPVLRSAIAEARAKQRLSSRPPRMDLLGRILKWFLEPPIRRRVKTRAPFVPRSTRARSEAFGEFARLQDQLLEVLASSRGVDLRRTKIVSPFDKRVRYNVYSAFRILAAHQRRHLWQAEQAVSELRERRAS